MISWIGAKTSWQLMLRVLRELMEITDAQAEGDAAKITAMRTCVGWFSSPVCALIYQVAKYTAMCSTKGYAIGRKFLEWMEARLADVDDHSELLGHSEDILAICGSRMYVFFLDAAPTERLLSQVDGTHPTGKALYALGRCVDDRGKRQRIDTRAGIQLGIFNDQAGHLEKMDVEELETTFNISRKASTKARKQTIKQHQQLIAAGRAKRAEREAKLGGKRARKAARAAEKARLEKVTLATKYSELKQMAIPDLSDQLRAFKLQGKTQLKFSVTQNNRIAYCTQLEALLLEAHGAAANDLKGDDSGCDGDGVVRKVRKRKASGSGTGKKRKVDGWNEIAGYWWQDHETFDIERILDKKVERRSVGKVRCHCSVPSPLPCTPFLHTSPHCHPPHCLLVCAGQEKVNQGILLLQGPLGWFPSRVRNVGARQ